MWWFKLYTLPQILRFTLIVTALILWDILTSYFLPRLNVLASFTYIFVLIPYFFLNGDRFSKNLDFHKMNVPLKLLKRQYLFHKIILHALNVLGLVIMGLLSSFYGSLKSDDFREAMPPTTVVIVFMTLVVGFSFSSFINKKKFTKNNRTQAQDGFSKTMRAAFVSLIGVPGGLYYFFGVPPLTLTLTLAVVLFTALMLIHFDQEFHRFRESKSVSMIAKNVFLAHVFAFSFFQVLGHFGKAEVFNEQLFAEKRATSYRIWNQSIPELDVVTFLEIEKGRIIHDSSLYYKVSPEIRQVSISHFIEEKSNKRLETYLKNVVPTLENQQFLVEHMVKNEKQWKLKKTTPQIKLLLSKHWPKDRALPDVLKVPKREIASKKKSLF